MGKQGDGMTYPRSRYWLVAAEMGPELSDQQTHPSLLFYTDF